MPKVIEFSRASEEYGCFSNFYPCSVKFGNHTYLNTEAAWHSLKDTDPATRLKYCTMTGSAAKRAGRRGYCRFDWDYVSTELMIAVVFAKFDQNAELRDILLSTGDAELVENTTGWHDNRWGNCNCPKCIDIPGENRLGKVLMHVRALIRSGQKPFPLSAHAENIVNGIE